MSRWIKIFVAATFFLSVLCIGIGYAQVTGNLTISGTAIADIPLIYIKSAVPVSGDGTVNTVAETTMNASANFSTSSNSAIYRVTVINRTQSTYGYLATAADPTVYQNSEINYTLYMDEACTDKMERRTELPPHANGAPGQLVYYVKVSAKTPSSASTPYQFLLRFDFKTPISDIPAPGADGGAVAVDNAMTKFATILNNDTSYTTLVDQMTGEGKVEENDRWNDSYIAYVPATINGTNFTDDDTCLALFGGELNLIIDGVEYQVYFLLKRENVDNSTATGNQSGEEYTLYMTTNPLTDSSSIFSQKKAVVYAGVFTSNDRGQNWYQLGDMLSGEAPICAYDGGGFGSGFGRPTGSGSFHTDSWKTTKAYYGVSSGRTVADVMSASVNDRTALQAAITKAQEITSNEYYETIYTEATRARLDSILSNAITINATPANYTQAQVVSCTALLNEAIASLADAS